MLAEHDDAVQLTQTLDEAKSRLDSLLYLIRTQINRLEELDRQVDVATMAYESTCRHHQNELVHAEYQCKLLEKKIDDIKQDNEFRASQASEARKKQETFVRIIRKQLVTLTDAFSPHRSRSMITAAAAAQHNDLTADEVSSLFDPRTMEQRMEEILVRSSPTHLSSSRSTLLGRPQRHNTKQHMNRLDSSNSRNNNNIDGHLSVGAGGGCLRGEVVSPPSQGDLPTNLAHQFFHNYNNNAPPDPHPVEGTFSNSGDDSRLLSFSSTGTLAAATALPSGGMRSVTQAPTDMTDTAGRDEDEEEYDDDVDVDDAADALNNFIKNHFPNGRRGSGEEEGEGSGRDDVRTARLLHHSERGLLPQPSSLPSRTRTETGDEGKDKEQQSKTNVGRRIVGPPPPSLLSARYAHSASRSIRTLGTQYDTKATASVARKE